MSNDTKRDVYFPVLISVSNRKCLIVGGGEIAYYKVNSLAKFASDITVVAPVVYQKLEDLEREGKIVIKRKEYQENDLDGIELVIAATGKKQISKKVWEDCHKRNILVNTVDDPALCDFILPATIKRGDLTVSVGTQGQAPFLTKELRRWLNRMFTPEWSEVVELAADFRKKVFERFTARQRKQRNECFARFMSVDWAGLLREKDPRELQDLIEDILEGKMPQPEQQESDE